MLHHAGKFATMLVGGGFAMMIPSHDQEDMVVRTAKMVAGMTGGAIIFNGIYNTGKLLCQKMIPASVTSSGTLHQEDLLNVTVIRSNDVDVIKSDTIFTDTV